MSSIARLGVCLVLAVSVGVILQSSADGAVRPLVAPTLASITPAAANPGQTVTVLLQGADFVPGATSVAVSGAGVTVSGVQVVNTTSLVATFAVAVTASSGARDVNVTTADGTSGNVTFTVNAVAIPTVTAISVPNGNRGQVVNITLTGTNFVVGNTIVSVPGVGVSNVNVASSTSLTATLTIGPGATIQNSTVSVTTPAGTGSGSIVFATLNVPTLTSLSTNTAFAGSTLSINYNGTNFTAFGATTVAVSGTGVTVNSVANTTGIAQRAVSLTIDPTATPGPRTTTVTTPGGTTAALTLNIVKSLGYITSTIGGKGAITEGGAATAQSLPEVRDVARDSSGNLYLAMPGTFKVYKITPGGLISTFAGTGVPGTLGDGGPALNAQFFGINGIAVDSSDNVYVTNLNEVRRIGTNGIVTLYAGKGSTSVFAQQIVGAFGGDGGPALYATFWNPSGLVFDAAGNLYVTDNRNGRIRKITPAGIISTVAGNGTIGYGGDGGLATEAQLFLESGATKVAVDAAGNIYISDAANHRIRKVTAADGIITTIAGTGNSSFSGDGGPALAAELSFPTGVAVDGSGNLFISDSNNVRIRKIGTDGNINTVAGNGGFLFDGDGPSATSQALANPMGLTVDPSGNVYFVGLGNRLRRLGTDGSLTTVAGDTGVFSGDGGVATQARFYFPNGITVDASGGILVADAAFGRIRRIAPGTNIISTIAGSGSFTVSGNGGPPPAAGLGIPYDAAVGPDGAIYVPASTLELGGTDSRIWKISSDGGTITTIAGGPTSGYSGDGGLALSAELNLPAGIAVDSAGNVYVSDSENNRVRKINASDGRISTIAGNGTDGFSGDGGPATSAQLSEPMGLAVDGSGNLYITDANNGRIRRVASDGTITTFSTITNARAVAVGGGAVFVTTGQTLTRFLDAGGSAQIAGFGPEGASGDGGPSRMSSISIRDMAVTPSGAIVFVDEDNHLVRQLTPAPTGSAVLSSFFGGIFYRTGNAAPLTLAAAVNLDGDGTFPWSATSSVTTPPGGTWLSLSSAGGTGSGSMTVTIDPAGLAPGNYQGTITISATGAVNGPITLPVTLTVMPSVITVSAPSLTFAGTANGFATSVPNLSVGNPNVGDLPVTLAPSVITPMGGTWFVTLSTTAGTAVAGSPVTAGSVLNLAGLAPGTYGGAITVTSAGAVNSPLIVPVTLNVTPAAAPTLSSLTPANGSQGQTINVTLTGTNFVYGATVAVSGTGVTVGSVTVSTPTSLTVTLTIGPSATVGARTISVTTPGGTTATQTFTILGPPTLTSLSPNSAGPGRTISLTLNGTNFAQNATVATISGTGVTLTPIAANASTSARTTTLTIAPDATLGAHSVTVTTPQGTSAPLNFVVTAPADTLISTYAGQSVVTGGGLAINQPLSLMSDVAMDSSGNFYIAGTHANKIFKVTPGGVLTTFAGTGTAGGAGDGGPATSAQLFFPGSVLVDAANNVLIADSSNNRIRKVASDGTITTVAGTGAGGFAGDGGPANLAFLNFPTAMALDPSGNLYLHDLNNRRLRKVSTTGIITTIAGTGTAGFLGDGLNGLLAQFSMDRQVMRLAADASGNVYFPDSANHRVRKVAADGTVSTIAGTGTAGFSGDNGPATSAQLNAPRGVALDSSGNLYISDANNNRIRKITAGTITTILGSGGYGFNGDGATPTSRQLSNPMGLFVDASGNVVFSDQGSNRIRSFSTAGTLTTLAGNGGGFAGDGAAAGASTLYQPNAIAFDTSGNLFIADGRNYRIRKVDAGTGNITTIAGTGVNGNSVDGTVATLAQIGYVNDMIVDASGNIYITTSQRVRKINASTGTISTVAGTGTQGYNGDGILATTAQLSNPSGLALDSSGSLFIGDSGNHRVRKVNLATDGFISTIAGTGTSGALGDGAAATAARLNFPTKLAFDTAGNLYIADSGNSRIRRVAASNQFISTFSTAGGAAVTFNNGSVYLASGSVITQVLSDGSTITLAGFGSLGFSGDGGPSLMASISVNGLAVSPSGIVYFADQPNNIIRKLTPVAPGFAVLSVSPTGIYSRLGNAASTGTTVTVSLNGTGTFTWTATPSETSSPSAQWLTVSVPSGTGGATTAVTVNASGLAPGYYQGSVTFASPQSANGNVVLPVTLTVLPSILVSSFSSLAPAGTAGGANPGATAFPVTQGGSGAPLAFTASATTVTGGSWLSVSPDSGTTLATVTASYNTAGLAPGVYNGSVVITSASASNSPLTIPVTLSLSPTTAATLASINPPSAAPGQVLTAVITGTSFAPTGNSVIVSGTTGITVVDVGLLSPTQLGVVFTVAAGAATGDRTVTVNNGIGTSNGITFAVVLPAGPRRGQVTSQ